MREFNLSLHKPCGFVGDKKCDALISIKMEKELEQFNFDYLDQTCEKDAQMLWEALEVLPSGTLYRLARIIENHLS